MVISQNIVSQFSPHSCDISVRDNGFSAFHTLMPRSPLIRAKQNKERTSGLLYLPKSCHFTDLTQFINDCVSRNGCRINTSTEPNKMILVRYHSFQKTMFCLMESKYAIFSDIKVTKIKHFAFFGDTQYMYMKLYVHQAEGWGCILLPPPPPILYFGNIQAKNKVLRRNLLITYCHKCLFFQTGVSTPPPPTKKEQQHKIKKWLNELWSASREENLTVLPSKHAYLFYLFICVIFSFVLYLQALHVRWSIHYKYNTNKHAQNS